MRGRRQVEDILKILKPSLVFPEQEMPSIALQGRLRRALVLDSS